MEANKRSPESIKSTKGILVALDKFKPIDNIQKDDIVKFFSEFKGADSSRNLYIVVIKKYFRDNDKSKIIDWLKPNKLKETIKSDDILTTEDINKLIENTDNLYFKALISFLSESGCRISEATNLKYNDFKPTTDGLIVNIKTTKTSAGYRKIILPFSSQYIMNLKTSIYAKDDDIVFKYQYNYMRDTIMEIAEKSGISKRVNPHAFRHFQATLMCQKGYNESIMKKKLGWSGSSKMVERYSHLSDEDVINSTLEIEGRKSINKKPMEQLNEAKPLSIDQAANRLFQLEDENEILKSDIQILKHEHEQDQISLKNELDDKISSLEKMVKNFMKYPKVE